DTVRLIGRLGCETAVIFHPAWPVHLLARLARVPVRFGFDSDGSGFSLTGAVPWRGGNDGHYVVDDYLRLAAAAATAAGSAGNGMGADRALQLHPGEAAERAARGLIESRGAGSVSPRPVGLAPGGGVNPRDRVPEKRWPARHFAGLADRIAGETGREIWLFGSPGETGLVREVAGMMEQPAIDFSGATTIRTLAGLIGRTGLLVTVDSAPMHIALALGVPLVGLFGPTRAAALLPLDHPGVRVVSSGKDCSPCYNNEPFPGCHRSVPCMEEIGLEAVYNACMQMLSRGGESR
ncbi:MAG: glycosyltransferase family 9 protein, partial [Anaerolineae bacterium]